MQPVKRDVPAFLRTPPKTIANPFIAQARSIAAEDKQHKHETNVPWPNEAVHPHKFTAHETKPLDQPSATKLEPRPIEIHSKGLILHPSLRKQEEARASIKPVPD